MNSNHPANPAFTQQSEWLLNDIAQANQNSASISVGLLDIALKGSCKHLSVRANDLLDQRAAENE